jgi:hypothetical protein
VLDGREAEADQFTGWLGEIWPPMIGTMKRSSATSRSRDIAGEALD